MAVAYAPIALFAYNRPEHLRRTLNALAGNHHALQSDLYVFSDGAKNPETAAMVAQTRAVIANATGFKTVTPVLSPRNLGLAGSIISGVGRLCESHGQVIVVEDDLVVSPHFLAYMNDALNVYEFEDRVVSVHGYIYPIDAALPETFFLRGADCWGWATWKRGWDVFEPDGISLRNRLKDAGLQNRFDFDGSYRYMDMLEDQIAGKNDSWAVRWYASAFLAGKLTLYPGRSLVSNIGADGSGTHVGSTAMFDVTLTQKPITVARLPLEENSDARNEVRKYFLSIRPTIMGRLKHKLRQLLPAGI